MNLQAGWPVRLSDREAKGDITGPMEVAVRYEQRRGCGPIGEVLAQVWGTGDAVSPKESRNKCPQVSMKHDPSNMKGGKGDISSGWEGEYSFNSDS